MIHFPIMRWGKEYKSLDVEPVVHFETGEVLAEVSQANSGLIARDMKKAHKAREILCQFTCDELIAMCSKAGDLFLNATLPAGDGEQTPEDFVKCQSATTGLPEHMCKFNMEKLQYVLNNLEKILTALTRGLPLDIFTKGYGMEGDLMRSYQAESPSLGMILPSNSPGVHGLWLPVIPLQIGLVLKPGPQEPWTPYRMMEAFAAAGIPKEVFAIYPGGAEVGAAVVNHCERVMLFGGTPTVEQYKGDDRVQVHGPGFSKILLGEDECDNWEDYIDLMVKSVLINSGRGCINCSGIWTPRHGKEIADAIAKKLGPVATKPAADDSAELAAFTVVPMAEAVNGMIDTLAEEEGVEEMTAKYRDGDRIELNERYAYLRPTVLHCDSPERGAASTEFMFPYVTVVDCPQDQMLKKIGKTLVASCITNDEVWKKQLIDATNIDRLNLGAMPTIQLNWLQPHEGNITDFLFRARAFQTT